MVCRLALALFAAALVLGCGSKPEAAVIPSVIKQPPASDGEIGGKKKAPDAGAQRSSEG